MFNTYQVKCGKHVTIMVRTFMVFGDVGKVLEVIRVLASTVDVPDLMFTHNLLVCHIDICQFGWKG